MQVIETAIPGLLVIEPQMFDDERGYFYESWNEARFAEAGITQRWVQDNVSFSKRGVLRGLHFQHPSGQAKLVSVLVGSVYDVAVDIRTDSPTFGRWVGVELSQANHRQFLIPVGFAHGFVVTGEHAIFSYKTGSYYAPGTEQTLAWDDRELDIAWPVANPCVSAKDAVGRRLAAIPRDRLPTMAEATR